jgi:hypothetical protein
MSVARSKYKVTKSLLLIGILITGLLSAFIGLVAYFGQYMGTFVISLDDASLALGIALCEHEEFEQSNSRLLVNPVNAANPTTFTDIKFGDAVTTDGDMDKGESNNYIAYTFYIRNEGNISVDVELNLNTITVTKNVDKALRIAVIEGGYVDEKGDVKFDKGTIYMKNDGNGDEAVVRSLTRIYREDENGNMIYYEKILYDSFTKELLNEENNFGHYVVENLVPMETRKFTIVFWLEGWDADCTDTLKHGQLKMKLVFTIRKMEDEEEDEYGY